MSWRDVARPIIAKVLHETPSNESAIRKALRAVYPFGERKYHPYKIWLDEIARQRKTKPPLGTFGPRAKERAENPDQERLWP